MLVAMLVVAACGSAPPPFSGIDCGNSTEGSGTDYDAEARECVWKAYSNGAAVRWSVRSYTTEGDPIPQTLRFDSALDVVTTRDMTADKFSSSADRRIPDVALCDDDEDGVGHGPFPVFLQALELHWRRRDHSLPVTP
jgi:hypothetical protein